jgi:methionyl-tRNA synthetase
VERGTEPGLILAGLRPYVAPEGLIAKSVIIVANLEPRKMRGLESQGMMLAASYTDGADRKVVILTTDLDVPPGSVIS